MFEVRDTTGGLLFQSAELAAAEEFFNEFSVIGDYIWDSGQGVMVVANVEKIIE